MGKENRKQWFRVGSILVVMAVVVVGLTACSHVMTMMGGGAKKPAQMDLVHADGVVWEAVYETTGDTFRLNYVVKGEKDPRPATFKTSEKTEESLVVLQRQKP